MQAAGGIQITASHNPAEWNGLKLFGPAGEVLTAAVGRAVHAIVENRAYTYKPWNELGHRDFTSAIDWHRDAVLKLVDTQAIRDRDFGVFLDANGGAGGPLGQRLLHAFGCHVYGKGLEADGNFAHGAEPTEENLSSVAPQVAQNMADVGFALDPDADRLAIIDEKGQYIGEELTLALAVQYRLGQETGPVVINMSSSRIVEDIAARFGCPCHRSAVGEVHVVQKMRSVGAVIGGEGNGGVIDPRIGGVRDPFIGMGLILSLMLESRKKLSDLVAELPKYHIVKDKYQTTRSRLTELFAVLQKRWSDAKSNTQDGLRLDWSNRWIHVRPSNTEPIVRVIAEAPQQTDAEKLCKEVGNLLR
jgi:phosphomannomutase